VKVSDDLIFEEFRKRREAEHFPVQYFINEKYLLISKNQFITKYRQWRVRMGYPISVITTQMYLNWLCNYFGVETFEISDRTNNLNVAVSAFLEKYGEDKVDQIRFITGLKVAGVKEGNKFGQTTTA
jgi:hypothetical protein